MQNTYQILIICNIYIYIYVCMYIYDYIYIHIPAACPGFSLGEPFHRKVAQV